MTVGAPFAGVGRDIYEGARETAAQSNGKAARRPKAAASA